MSHCQIMRLLAIIGTIVLCGAALADTRQVCVLERVIDGDTIVCHVGDAVGVRVRLIGIDAPEMRGHCPRERESARAATAYLSRVLWTSQLITLSGSGAHDRWGRLLARVQADGEDVSGKLLRIPGLAVPYDGGRRHSWCDVSGVTP